MKIFATQYMIMALLLASSLVTHPQQQPCPVAYVAINDTSNAQKSPDIKMLREKETALTKQSDELREQAYKLYEEAENVRKEIRKKENHEKQVSDAAKNGTKCYCTEWEPTDPCCDTRKGACCEFRNCFTPCKCCVRYKCCAPSRMDNSECRCWSIVGLFAGAAVTGILACTT